MSFEAVINEFVERVNISPRELLFDEEAPPSVRVGTTPRDTQLEAWEWRIKPWENIHWVEELEAKLPHPFPKSFRCLITRYIFPQFDFGPVRFFANTPEGICENDELRTGIFRDRHLSAVLLLNGFVQFGRVVGGGYDPVCFDGNRKSATGEHPIVVLDHECVLCYEKIRITETLASCFTELISR